MRIVCQLSLRCHHWLIYGHDGSKRSQAEVDALIALAEEKLQHLAEEVTVHANLLCTAIGSAARLTWTR